MKPIFMDRDVMPEETVKKQKEFIDKIFEYDLKIESDVNELFWVSSIQIKNLEPGKLMYSTTKGKGTTKIECLASNYGELIERYSLHKFMERVFAETNIENILVLDDLTLNTHNNIKVKELQYYLKEESTAYTASGNTKDEALFHALCELYELRMNSPSRTVHTDCWLIRTEKMFPELPKKIHNNFHFFVKKDVRIPLYDLFVLRAPNKSDTFFQKDDIEIINGEIRFTKQEEYFRKTIVEPSPPFCGRRIGPNIEKLVKIAICELMQQYRMSIKEINLPDTNIKKCPNYLNVIDACDLKNYDQNDIAENNKMILNSFRDGEFNVWALNVTLPNCEFPVVKLISNYWLETHFDAKLCLSQFFDLQQAGIK